ncbi:MAG: hypothetical protein KGI27_07890 [Thaumarchaeota archaeon]|nr:hypothetical protein [Nitrososphaerota archaeon]
MTIKLAITKKFIPYGSENRSHASPGFHGSIFDLRNVFLRCFTKHLILAGDHAWIHAAIPELCYMHVSQVQNLVLNSGFSIREVQEARTPGISVLHQSGST